MKKVHIRSLSQRTLETTSRLALYDQYGSMAYGIILRIIPEEELAQAVLVDLFTSSQLTDSTEPPTAGEVIRLARTKALAARPSNAIPASSATPDDTTDTAKLVFNLSFWQGCTREAIAEDLQLPPTNVLKTFFTFFNQLRSS